MVEELLKTKKHNIVVLDNLQKGHRNAVVGGEFIEGGLGRCRPSRQGLLPSTPLTPLSTRRRIVL